jgi:hypothetical protein
MSDYGLTGASRSDDARCYALIEHTISLIRQGSLSHEQGKTLLRNLLCEDRKF